MNLHQKVFLSLEFLEQPAIGRKTTTFQNVVKDIEFLPRVWREIDLEKPLNRQNIFDLCKDEQVSNALVLSAIFAWGGMRMDHAALLFSKNSWPVLNEIVDVLRTNKSLTAFEVYQLFYQKRKSGQLKGLGIAYFTKVIYFLCPHLDVFILDQWIGKSINLILGAELVKLTKTGKSAAWVNDSNDAKLYQHFCGEMMKLSELSERNRHELEQMMFCKGGKKPGFWRAHVKKHWS